MGTKLRILATVAAFLLSACQTMQLTPEGVAVRTITPVVAASCRHVGLANSFQPVLAGGMSAAEVDIRNKVARIGGNAMVVTAKYLDSPTPHGNISVEAYKCEFSAQKPEPKTASLGVVLVDLSTDLKTQLERNAGAVVSSVTEDSAAWKANLIPNDVLIAVNGEIVKNGRQGTELMDAAKGAVVVTVIRKGAQREISIPR